MRYLVIGTLLAEFHCDCEFCQGHEEEIEVEQYVHVGGGLDQDVSNYDEIESYLLNYHDATEWVDVPEIYEDTEPEELWMRRHSMPELSLQV
jgi:hypothetical protein